MVAQEDKTICFYGFPAHPLLGQFQTDPPAQGGRAGSASRKSERLSQPETPFFQQL